MQIDKLNMDLMNIPITEESRYSSLAEWKAYREGHRDARHAAVEVVLEHTQKDASEEGMFSEEWKNGYSAGFEAAKNLLANKDK